MGFLEMPGEMRLIGKACFERDIDEAPAAADHAARPLKPAHDEIAVRAGAKAHAEMPGECEAVEATDVFEFGAIHLPIGMGLQEVAGLADANLIGGLDRGFAIAIRMPQQSVGYAGQHLIELQIIDRSIEVTHDVREVGREGPVGDDRRGNEGQAARFVAQRTDQHFRRQIHHPVAQAFVRSGTAVMDLVGMQHDDITGLTVADYSTIAERLDALQRQAERVGVMAMRLKGIAVKMRLDPLDAA